MRAAAISPLLNLSGPAYAVADGVEYALRALPSFSGMHAQQMGYVSGGSRPPTLMNKTACAA
jgi:hypothetical protein